MTEGVEVHQAQANSAAVETDPGSEEPDQQEEDSSSILEVQHHSTGGAEDSSGGPVAPDGGWGWVVVAATVLVLAMTLAFPSCIGIFYTDLQNNFQASNTEISWVPAIMMAVLHAGGILVDSTSQYAYVFFACSITGSTAGLFIMLSFYWLDRQKCRELKTSFTHKDINSLKPSTKMTIDCDYSPVPLHANNIRDMETDV